MKKIALLPGGFKPPHAGHYNMAKYLAKETKAIQNAMLIYNKRLSVCTITTHLPLKFVAKNINKKKIIEKININKFKSSKKNNNQILNARIGYEILKKDNLKFEGVSIDSKQIKKNNLFIAIKGKKQNRHFFLKEALKNKAKFCVVEKYIKDIKTLLKGK